MRRTSDEPSPAPSGNDHSRRRFLALSSLFAASVVLRAQATKGDGGLAPILPKEDPGRSTPIKPAGSRSLRAFGRHCTACQLCVSACPNQVLKPSKSMRNRMQPEMSFERGYCRPECTRCADVCPTGAIHHITTAEKSAIQIGHAVLNPALCIVNRDQVHCNNCARHCAPGAIRMVPRNPGDPGSLKIPMIDTERCIGCGACEFLCPSRPKSAIHVEGHETHRIV
ncbi:MAG TPA: 4Fe-4S dicluster domain-containing protein [Holophaga sp.]|nr:4Fe-4S dicluster domain-containing protein [Holophaga sp.]